MVRQPQKLDYICTPQTVRDEDGCPRDAYRFEVLDVGGEAPVLLCALDDICGSGRQACALEGLFRRNKVSLVHVYDVLEDWLAG